MSLAAEITQAVDSGLTTEQKIEEIYQFCARLALLLDQLGNNPMIQAMMPPGLF